MEGIRKTLLPKTTRDNAVAKMPIRPGMRELFFTLSLRHMTVHIADITNSPPLEK